MLSLILEILQHRWIELKILNHPNTQQFLVSKLGKTRLDFQVIARHKMSHISIAGIPSSPFWLLFSKNFLYLFSVIDDSSITFFGHYDLLRIICLYRFFMILESAGRAKREGFVDLNSIPNMMRGFAQNLGRGFNNMVQHSQNLGHK